ncbi:MAG TPA: protein kinase [Polyangiaceae bacterium]|nr:protein kinase [Polyangiaceae bacterium]
MLTPPALPAVVHATLSGYVAFALLHGAASPLRRRLGVAFLWFCLYSVTIGALYAIDAQLVAWSLNLACLLFAGIAATHFADFARLLALGDARPVASARLRVGVPLAGAALCLLGQWQLATGRSPNGTAAAFDLWIFVAFMVGVALLVLAVRRQRPGAWRFLAAYLLPIFPLVLDLGRNAGLVVPGYHLARGLALLGFCFLALSAYMNRATEPMSLRRRLVAGTLAVVLAVVMSAGGLVAAALPGASPHEQHVVTGALLGLTLASTLAVLVVFPLLFAKTVFEPVAALLHGARQVEAGEEATVAIARTDELGTVAAAFNEMVAKVAAHRKELEAQVASLQQRNEEIATLNTELRRQVAARSRQLQETLGKEGRARFGLAVGDTVDGRYRVVARLGGGGMGVVYEVARSADSRRLAMKVIAGASSRHDLVRFAREAEIASTVAHPNIVPVVDVGLHEGLPFLVMELVDGGSLDAARARFGDVAWGLSVLTDVAAALVELHRSGVVHRDLKPANVLLEREAAGTRARLCDFGIARHDVDVLAATAHAEGPAPTSLTATGAPIGTLPYMAPEAGRGAANVTPKVDVFALGLIGYELLGGAHPFPIPPVLEALAGRDLPPPPLLPEGVPPPVQALLAACVRQRPEERPTAAEALEVLESAAAHAPARPPAE